MCEQLNEHIKGKPDETQELNQINNQTIKEYNKRSKMFAMFNKKKLDILSWKQLVDRKIKRFSLKDSGIYRTLSFNFQSGIANNVSLFLKQMHRN